MEFFGRRSRAVGLTWRDRDSSGEPADVIYDLQFSTNRDSKVKSVRLIASDLDGTLLRDDKTISERTRNALRNAQAAGIQIVLATARPPFTAQLFALDAGVTGIAVCSNGAILYDLHSDEILEERYLDAETALRLVSSLRQAMPDVCFAAVQVRDFACEQRYSEVARFEDHGRLLEEMTICDTDEFVTKPITKLLVRHPEYRPEQFVHHLANIGFDGFESAHSGAPFLEITAAGVTKASALVMLCERLSISADEVVAFGDAPNDAAMLRWAGHGVAVANGFPAALEAADEVTLSNEEDGVAVIIERLLSNQTPPLR
jgi:Cof subfamily protein (haloacid dehalogenase superfamily)